VSRGQRSQAIVEFSIIAPILLLLIFGIIDFGRVIYTYVTLNQAVNEGARAAVIASAPLPTNLSVETAVKNHAVDVSLANPCTNGPIENTAPPPNSGWIYITEPQPGPPWPTTVEQLSATLFNAPGGQVAAGAAQSTTDATPTCSAINPINGHHPLQVSIVYNFVPLTPLIQQVTANHIIITAAAVYKTEY
jgi:TadE-like protein